jgi:hypothetical protein
LRLANAALPQLDGVQAVFVPTSVVTTLVVSVGSHRCLSGLAINAQSRELDGPVLHLKAVLGVYRRQRLAQFVIVHVDDFLALTTDQVVVGSDVDIVTRFIVQRVDLHNDPQLFKKLEVFVDRIE